MAQLPGMLGDVYWDSPAKPLPNWREHDRPDGDDDDPPDPPRTDEECEDLLSRTGLDPRELWPDADSSADDDDEEDSDDEPLSKSFERLMKANEEFWRQEGCL